MRRTDVAQMPVLLRLRRRPVTFETQTIEAEEKPPPPDHPDRCHQGFHPKPAKLNAPAHTRPFCGGNSREHRHRQRSDRHVMMLTLRNSFIRPRLPRVGFQPRASTFTPQHRCLRGHKPKTDVVMRNAHRSIAP
jgi:hypothetical protein